MWTTLALIALAAYAAYLRHALTVTNRMFVISHRHVGELARALLRTNARAEAEALLDRHAAEMEAESARFRLTRFLPR